MKKNIIAATVAITMSASGSAFASSGMYANLLIGGSFNNDVDFTQDIDPADDYYKGKIDLDNGLAFSAAIGNQYGNFSAEVELSYLNGDTGLQSFPDASAPSDEADTNGDISVTALMLNGWYSFGEGPLRPFVGAGLGYAKASIDTSFDIGGNNGIDDSDSGFAWQVGAGVEYALSDTTSLVGVYKYMNMDSIDVTDNEDTDISTDFSTHIVQVGLKMKF
ncbi:outer membrane protein [Solemya velum gill symbiont]|nr:outer membrane beta-barrel protein [Solemya velum gill symbiont]